MLSIIRLLYAPFFCASDTGGNVYSSEFRFIESLPGPSQFSEPHPDDSERFYDYLFDYGVQNGMRAFEVCSISCLPPELLC